jgi:dipeptide/tripeptide permease
MRKYLIAIIILSFFVVLFDIIYEQQKQIKLYKSNNLSKNIDSLQTELFQSQSNEGRYEMAFEILLQYDSVAASKFDSIYKNETE